MESSATTSRWLASISRYGGLGGSGSIAAPARLACRGRASGVSGSATHFRRRWSVTGTGFAQRIRDLTSRMRESRMSGSVGGPGGQPPGPTRPGRVERVETRRAAARGRPPGTPRASRGLLRLLLLRHLDHVGLLLLGLPGALQHGQAHALAEARVDLGADVVVVLQELARVLPSLAHALAVEGVPRPRLLDDLVVDAEVEQVALLADALAVEDVELRFAERGGDLVLDDLDLGPAADDDVALLQGGDATDVDADRGVELQRAAAGGGLRVAEHHADLLAE